VNVALEGTFLPSKKMEVVTRESFHVIGPSTKTPKDISYDLPYFMKMMKKMRLLMVQKSSKLTS